jgi:hypothetical protein
MVLRGWALKQVVDDVAKAESERILINPWEEGDVPEELIPPVERPLAVKPCFTRRWDSLDVTELTFPNGLRVAYKCTDLLDDQVILSGFAAGGLSELPKGRRYDAASCAALLVNEIGIFGHKPEIIADILAGKRCQVSTSTQAYRRSFGGEQSPLDLSEALQLVVRASSSPHPPSDAESCILWREGTSGHWGWRCLPAPGRNGAGDPSPTSGRFSSSVIRCVRA